MGQRTRGIWPFRQTWWSICSKHRSHDGDCRLCAAGRWQFDFVHALDGWVNARHYGLWFRWHNRPRSSARRFLSRHFPNLR